MRYCYNCNRATIGDPLFCNFCGRSYNIKLCQKLHVNPRNAEACSRCGSRDLSTPQPKVPFWATFLLLALTVLQMALGMLWWGWTEIPRFFREKVHKMLQRRNNGEND